MNCIIIDDDPMSRKIVQKLVEQIEFLSLKEMFANAFDGAKYIRNNDVDLVFLDIEICPIGE